MTKAGELAAALGKGLVSGAIGTGVMTLAQVIEMKVTGREASNAPLDAVRKVLGIEPVNEPAAQRLNQMVHWVYGTQWGAVHGLLAALGVPRPAAAAGHFAAIWGAALVMLPALGVAPPPARWGKQELLKDAGFHLLYAIAVALAYQALESEGDR